MPATPHPVAPDTKSRAGAAARETAPGAASPTFSGQEGGRPRAFPVVQLKRSGHVTALRLPRVSAAPGPKFSHFQGGPRAGGGRMRGARPGSPQAGFPAAAAAAGRARPPEALPARPGARHLGAALLHPVLPRPRKTLAFPLAYRKHFPCPSFWAYFWT